MATATSEAKPNPAAAPSRKVRERRGRRRRRSGRRRPNRFGRCQINAARAVATTAASSGPDVAPRRWTGDDKAAEAPNVSGGSHVSDRDTTPGSSRRLRLSTRSGVARTIGEGPQPGGHRRRRRVTTPAGPSTAWAPAMSSSEVELHRQAVAARADTTATAGSGRQAATASSAASTMTSPRDSTASTRAAASAAARSPARSLR